MKKLLMIAVATVLMLMLVSAAAMAADIYVTYDGSKSASANGKALSNAIRAANAGDTVYVSAGEFAFDNNSSRFDSTNSKNNITIIGAGSGTDKTTSTIITSSKYGFVLQNDNLDNGWTWTLENMRVSASSTPIYVKNNITVYLKDMVLTGANSMAILLDSSNSIGGQFHNDLDTVVYAENVDIDSGDTVELNTNPSQHTDPSGDTVSYAHFYFDSDCANITERVVKPQSVAKGFNNMFCNDDVVEDAVLTGPADVHVKAGETATFTVSGKNANTFQWQGNANDGNGWQNIGGATGASFTTPAAPLEANGYQFRCYVNGCFYSDAATLTVTERGPVPDTGDHSNIALYAVLLCVAAALLTVTAKKTRSVR